MRQPEEQKVIKRAYVKRMKRIRILFWCAFVCLLFAGTGTLLAKYYAKESRKGVATASGLYFTSNYLEAVKGSEVDDLPERVNTNQWLGTGTCSIGIEVYNYSNILLYNDENLNITYDMHFKMLEAPGENETYKVVYTTYDDGEPKNNEIDLTDTEEHTIEGLYLPGGQATSNSVQLQITPKADANEKVDNSYRSKKVAVWVEPTAPDYVAMSNKLGAILSATPSKQAFSLKGAFDVSEKMEDKDLEACRSLIQSYAGFTYKVQTSGELDESYEGKKLKITWNSTYLEMDMYNKYYQEAKEKNLVTEATNNESGLTYTSITMDLVSYTSMEFDFYKTTAQNTASEEAQGTKKSFSDFEMNNVEDFNNLVIVEAVGDTN